jgi:HAD superfamily hydrolase (TIGR01509 family)
MQHGLALDFSLGLKTKGIKTIMNADGMIRSEKKQNVAEVLFDFEGTLVDFQWKPQQAIEETLEALESIGFHREHYGETPTYAIIFNSVQKRLEEEKGSGPAAAAAALVDKIYDRYDADALSRWNIYPDTIEALQELRKLGFKMGLVSNIGKTALDAAVDRLGLRGQLSVLISRSDVTRQKPHAQGLLKAAALLNVPPSRCILIGDSREDVGAARNAGMLAGHLRGGQHSAESMRESPADLEIDRLGELPLLLNRVGS